MAPPSGEKGSPFAAIPGMPAPGMLGRKKHGNGLRFTGVEPPRVAKEVLRLPLPPSGGKHFAGLLEMIK